MSREQKLALVGIALVALVLAFPLREAVFQIVVLPLSYIFWVIGVYYRSFSQTVVWGIFVGIVLLVLLGNISSGWRRNKKKIQPKHTLSGPVEQLSVSLQKTPKGIYYRWRVANRLSILARNLLAQRDGIEVKEVYQKQLQGSDWSPPHIVDEYLQAGLYSSFSSYPLPRWWFQRTDSTPLDLEVEIVVDFLEGQMKDNS